MREKSQNLRVYAPNRNLLGLKNNKRRKKVEMMIWQLVEWCWLDPRRPKVVGSGGNLPVGRRQARGQHSGWFCYSLSSLMLLLLSFFVILCHHCCHYLYHHHRCQSAGDQRASLKLVLVVILSHHCYHHFWWTGSQREKTAREALSSIYDNIISC